MRRRAQRRKYHYFYKTTCKVTGNYYYGMHSTDNLDDGYIGSGKRLWYSINKHGIENHVCEKLEFFDTREKLVKKEVEFVNENLIKDPMCMNLMKGGTGGKISDIQQKNRSSCGGKAYAKRLKMDKEFQEKIKISTTKGAYNLHKKRKENNQFNLNYIKTLHDIMTNKIWITNGIICTRINKNDDIPTGWKKGRKLHKACIV